MGKFQLKQMHRIAAHTYITTYGQSLEERVLADERETEREKRADNTVEED